MTEIRRIIFGKTVMPESWIVKEGRKDTVWPIVFSVFLLKTETRLLLADAGCETMTGFEMTDFIGTAEALKREGISPSDITDVIVTHAHHDHIECVKYFPGARIHIQRKEYEAGKRYIPDGFAVCPFDEEAALGEGITVKRIGGHSAGSSVIEIETAGKPTVICGDECYTSYNLTHRVPTATSCDPARSRYFIDRYAGGAYTCLLSHEVT